MRRNLIFPAVAFATLAIGSAAAQPPEISAETLAALDPTRVGRAGCRGLDGSGATLDARLRLAQDVAREKGLGAGPIGLYRDIAPSDLPLGTIDPMVRKYFDQGLALAYGFNHAASIRSFRLARDLDPGCAMCAWGEAMANGPNINAGMDDEQNRAALHALEDARRLAAGNDALVSELIEAQAARYSAAPDADRAALDRDYATAMMEIAGRNPDSDDLAILAAEAGMNTAPWDYWDAETGEPRPFVGEAVKLIEGVMARSPMHPQASHLYIHLLELPQPQRAEAAADRLRQSAPAVLGHLVHMPSHIYYRLGRYGDSIDANVAAVRADEEYLADVGDDGLVRFGYYPHNVHFLLTSAQMMGDVGTVVSQSAKLDAILDVDTGRELPWVQAIYAAPFFALAQYGSSAATLALTDEPHELAYVEAMRRYARALAQADAGSRSGFDAELKALETLQLSEGVTEMEGLGFPAPLIVGLAREVAQGRMAMALKRYPDAIAHFGKAAEMQKAIPYNEPPYWYYPVSQSLGAAYYRAGRYDDARQAFRAALFDAPNNALALYGLAQTERKLGNRPEAAAAEAAFGKVWRGKDEWLDIDRI